MANKGNMQNARKHITIKSVRQQAVGVTKRSNNNNFNISVIKNKK